MQDSKDPAFFVWNLSKVYYIYKVQTNKLNVVDYVE